MHIVRSRGWLLVVLFLMVVAVAWATAGTAAPTGSPTVISALHGGKRPGVSPAMGEPDTGTSPTPAKKNGLVIVPGPTGGEGLAGRDHPVRVWLWIYRSFMLSYLGAR